MKNTEKNNIPNFPRKMVYFEKQSNDRLCGVHCLNAVLQGPYVDPIMLSEIGLKLDDMENRLYGGDFSQHENVDDDGNYNIQVLTEALKIYGAEIQALRNNEAVKMIERNLDNLECFIFNSSTHWFAIRKINNIWFNLNSTNSFPGPEIISDFYLSAFLQGTEDIGYTNFLVKKLPILPEIESENYKNLQNYQRLVIISDIIKAKEAKKNNTNIKEEEKKEDEKKFNAFSGKGIKLSDDENNNNNLNENFQDDEMKQAYQLSLEEYIKDLEVHLPQEPSEGDSNSYNIILKHTDGTFRRRFLPTDSIYVKFFILKFRMLSISLKFN